MATSRTDIYGADNKDPISKDKLEGHLRMQFGYLLDSSLAFDKGKHEEAPRIATALRVLFHQTGSSHALLNQLGVLSQLNMKNTGIYREDLDRSFPSPAAPPGVGIITVGGAHPEVGFLRKGALVDGSIGWLPIYDQPMYSPSDPRSKLLIPFQPFDKWWRSDLVEGPNHRTFSREKLVLVMANQDGGAHVDGELDRDYAALSENGDIERGFVTFIGQQSPLTQEEFLTKPWSEIEHLIPPLRFNRAYAAVRQIAHEVILTLRDDPLTRDIVAPCFKK